VGATVAGCYMIGGYRMQGALWARKGGPCSAARCVSVAGNLADPFCRVSQANLLEIIYGLFQLKCLTLIFPIHNMFKRNCTKKQ
jgi:hypothetical protein